MKPATPRRAPECLATTIRKVEPMGSGMVRLFRCLAFRSSTTSPSVLDNGPVFPSAAILDREAVRSIVEANGPDEGGPDLVPVATIPYRGTVN
ncbi:hypothetical protein ABIF65_009491 [Bradyrhizobium japonicum]|uniref:Uncharacterized protein n=1 Tax=Bradyrhizobium barranii subsp. barranii TaxID=2823807 RepID=A0A939LYD0_9BRAD|nr:MULTISPECIES: hypothetical protein [Bradyrhizobium]MCP1747526.1 hypothetical protein [Bradyrhizobium japonicum]MCP1865198.1 hypothetical protein [Bradyrhizobium japonicum]MCP1896029.1 hypothetical protein [Bradyrhizobium japonicum]MCW2329415.1 hypothetical protein [Bradyrhizobium japonicum]UEM12429.1 hypothetical protein J4G43_049955 [Bradyrhizobium barranii subsp. barranii]